MIHARGTENSKCKSITLTSPAVDRLTDDLHHVIDSLQGKGPVFVVEFLAIDPMRTWIHLLQVQLAEGRSSVCRPVTRCQEDAKTLRKKQQTSRSFLLY